MTVRRTSWPCGQLGENLFLARSGAEALRHMLDMDFAVVLVDVYMPIMDGFEMATAIRRRERSRFTPIIFLTAVMHTETNMFQGYAAGAVDYLFKPVNPAVVLSKVRVFVTLARQTAAIQRLNA